MGQVSHFGPLLRCGLLVLHLETEIEVFLINIMERFLKSAECFPCLIDVIEE